MNSVDEIISYQDDSETQALCGPWVGQGPNLVLVPGPRCKGS